jgi:Flp pilus assembly protein TadD/predicted Zn-dependent protease
MPGTFFSLSCHFYRLCRSCFFSSFCLALSVAPPLAAKLSSEDARCRAADLCNESVLLLKDAKYEAAEARLNEALKLDPDNAATLSNFGLVLSKLGRLAEARKHLEKSVALDPKSDAALLNLGLTCEGLGDLPAARAYLMRFIEISRDKDLAEKMKDHVTIINKTLSAGVPSGDGPDYFGQVKRSQMNPWPKELMPIKIFIASGTDVPGYKPGYGEVLDNAIKSWSEALQGIVSFSRTGASEEALIEVHWTNDYKTALMKAEGGDCKFVANSAGMKHADITLLTVDPSKAEKLTDAKVSWVALHEFGHALGLAAHSNTPQDIMYFAVPLKKSMPALSERDIATFKRLYTEKLADTWLTLNGEAIKLMKAGRHRESLEKLEQAAKLNPEQKVIKENMVLAEEGIIKDLLDAKKYAEAEARLLKALDLEKVLQDENLDDLLNYYTFLLKNSGRGGEVTALYKRYGKKPPSS